MKKILFAIVAVLMVCVSFDASAQNFGRRTNTLIQYDDIDQDAAYRQFVRASWTNQREILITLTEGAKDAYLASKTIEDIYDVKSKIEIIKYYNNTAKPKARSITVTNNLKVLDRKITQTEAEYKKAKVITKSVDIDYKYDPTDF